MNFKEIGHWLLKKVMVVFIIGLVVITIYWFLTGDLRPLDSPCSSSIMGLC